jgi:CBS domain containing-hemolysin-like protein
VNGFPEYFYFILPVLILLSAFFSGSETALFSIGKADIFRMANGTAKEKKIYRILVSPEKVLISLLLCNLLVNISVSTIIAEICIDISPKYGHYFAMLIATPLIIIFGEIMPKVVAINNSLRFAKAVISPFNVFHFIVTPIRFLILGIMHSVIKILKIDFSDSVNITEGEIDAALDISKDDGALQPAEIEFIRNVIKLSKKTAQSIMIPRNEITVIEYGTSIEKAMQIFMKKKFMRIPVFKDNIDNIVGFLDYRYLLPYHYGLKKAKNINKLLLDPNHFPSTKELSSLLYFFIEKRIQMAVVVDEYGGTMGIVTLSSMIAEVMGEKFSLSREEIKPEVRSCEGISVITGDMQIVDFNSEFAESIKTDDSETIAGFIIEKLERLPFRGDTVAIDRHILRVRSVRRKRIETIEVLEKVND